MLLSCPEPGTRGSTGHRVTTSGWLAPVPQQKESQQLFWPLLPRSASRCLAPEELGNGEGPGDEKQVNLLKTLRGKGREALSPCPRWRVVERTRSHADTWTPCRSVDLLIENIIAFDFSKYQG